MNVKEEYLKKVIGKKIKDVLYDHDYDRSNLRIIFTDDSYLDIDTEFNDSGMNLNIVKN